MLYASVKVATVAFILAIIVPLVIIAFEVWDARKQMDASRRSDVRED